jgi:hypothetical protein
MEVRCVTLHTPANETLDAALDSGVVMGGEILRAPSKQWIWRKGVCASVEYFSKFIFISYVMTTSLVGLLSRLKCSNGALECV